MRAVFTEQINLKIDAALKDDLEKLKYMKVEVAVLLREAIRMAVDRAFEVLQDNQQAS